MRLADDPQIQEYLRDGQKIAAVKGVRELTGLGLREAVDAVDALARGEEPLLSRTSPPPAEGMSEVHALLAADKKIDAIAAYRRIAGCGLKEAKEAVDALAAAQALKGEVSAGIQPHSPEGIDAALRQGNAAAAIARYQQTYGGSREAAERAVAERRNELGLGRRGCLGAVLGLPLAWVLRMASRRRP